MSRFTPRSANYWRLTAIVKREEPVCWLCGQEIEAWRRKPDPMAFQCDHVRRVRDHPELAEERSNMRASHARCNRDRERTKTPSPTQLGVFVSVDDF